VVDDDAVVRVAAVADDGSASNESTSAAFTVLPRSFLTAG